MGRGGPDLTLSAHRRRRERAWNRRKLASKRTAAAFLSSDWPRERHLGEIMAACRDRFESKALECGCADDQERVVSHHARSCQDRQCALCAHVRSSELSADLAGRADRLLREYPGARLVMLTVTVRNVGQIGQIHLKKLIRDLARLRRTELWVGVLASARGIEITWSQRAGFHHHAHMLLAVAPGVWLADQSNWSDAWFKITGDSRIVDIREVSNGAEAAREVAKYITKQPKDAPAEIIRAIHRAAFGVQLWARTGLWRGDGMAEPEAEPVTLSSQVGYECPKCHEFPVPVLISRVWMPERGKYEVRREVLALDPERLRLRFGESPSDLVPSSRADWIPELPEAPPPAPPPDPDGPAWIPHPRIDRHGHHRGAVLAVTERGERWRPVCGCGWRARGTFGTEWRAEAYAMNSHSPCVPDQPDEAVYPADHQPELEGIA